MSWDVDVASQRNKVIKALSKRGRLVRHMCPAGGLLSRDRLSSFSETYNGIIRLPVPHLGLPLLEHDQPLGWNGTILMCMLGGMAPE